MGIGRFDGGLRRRGSCPDQRDHDQRRRGLDQRPRVHKRCPELSFTLPQALNSGLTITSSSLRNAVNANVLVGSPQISSLSVPATFEVIRVGGTQSITVRTVGAVANFDGSGAVTGVADGGLFSQPVTVVGNIDSGQLSFNIASPSPSATA